MATSGRDKTSRGLFYCKKDLVLVVATTLFLLSKIKLASQVVSTSFSVLDQNYQVVTDQL